MQAVQHRVVTHAARAVQLIARLLQGEADVSRHRELLPPGWGSKQGSLGLKSKTGEPETRIRLGVPEPANPIPPCHPEPVTWNKGLVMEKCSNGCGRWVTTPDVSGRLCLTCHKALVGSAPSPLRTPAKSPPHGPQQPACRICGECFATWEEVYAHKCPLRSPRKEPAQLTPDVYRATTRGK